MCIDFIGANQVRLLSYSTWRQPQSSTGGMPIPCDYSISFRRLEIDTGMVKPFRSGM